MVFIKELTKKTGGSLASSLILFIFDNYGSIKKKFFENLRIGR
jgi:hypothetical protein